MVFLLLFLISITERYAPRKTEKEGPKESLFSKFSTFFSVEMEMLVLEIIKEPQGIFLLCFNVQIWLIPNLHWLVVPGRKPQSLTKELRWFGMLL